MNPSAFHVTPSASPGRACFNRQGMSLVELMIAVTISGIVTVAVLSSYLFIVRSTLAVGNYQSMDAQMRGALDLLSADVRTATALSTTATSITLSNASPDYAAYGGCVTYAFDNSATGSTSNCFYRMPGNPSDSNPKLILARNVSALDISRITALGTESASDANTKKLRVTLTLSSTVQGSSTNTESTISALFILRNR
ncbi:MAG: prepilin-type N-terminal cleavage/methylation domain-containing protein [Opitutaceae bacterium]|jgi:prepilin-type N-terminal cleavage/methylation domain-containing protein